MSALGQIAEGLSPVAQGLAAGNLAGQQTLEEKRRYLEGLGLQREQLKHTERGLALHEKQITQEDEHFRQRRLDELKAPYLAWLGPLVFSPEYEADRQASPMLAQGAAGTFSRIQAAQTPEELNQALHEFSTLHHGHMDDATRGSIANGTLAPSTAATTPPTTTPSGVPITPGPARVGPQAPGLGAIMAQTIRQLPGAGTSVAPAQHLAQMIGTPPEGPPPPITPADLAQMLAGKTFAGRIAGPTAAQAVQSSPRVFGMALPPGSTVTPQGTQVPRPVTITERQPAAITEQSPEVAGAMPAEPMPVGPQPTAAPGQESTDLLAGMPPALQEIVKRRLTPRPGETIAQRDKREADAFNMIEKYSGLELTRAQIDELRGRPAREAARAAQERSDKQIDQALKFLQLQIQSQNSQMAADAKRGQFDFTRWAKTQQLEQQFLTGTQRKAQIDNQGSRVLVIAKERNYHAVKQAAYDSVNQIHSRGGLRADGKLALTIGHVLNVGGDVGVSRDIAVRHGVDLYDTPEVRKYLRLWAEIEAAANRDIRPVPATPEDAHYLYDPFDSGVHRGERSGIKNLVARQSGGAAFADLFNRVKVESPFKALRMVRIFQQLYPNAPLPQGVDVYPLLHEYAGARIDSDVEENLVREFTKPVNRGFGAPTPAQPPAGPAPAPIQTPAGTFRGASPAAAGIMGNFLQYGSPGS